jgi:hypothetical protein
MVLHVEVPIGIESSLATRIRRGSEITTAIARALGSVNRGRVSDFDRAFPGVDGREIDTLPQIIAADLG